MPGWNRSYMHEKKPIGRPDGNGNKVSCCPTCKKPLINFLNRSNKSPSWCVMCGQILKREESGNGKS